MPGAAVGFAEVMSKAADLRKLVRAQHHDLMPAALSTSGHQWRVERSLAFVNPTSRRASPAVRLAHLIETPRAAVAAV